MGCKNSKHGREEEIWTSAHAHASSLSQASFGKAENNNAKKKEIITKSFHETKTRKLATGTHFSENDCVVLKTLFDSVTHEDNAIDEGEFVEALFGKKKKLELEKSGSIGSDSKNATNDDDGDDETTKNFYKKMFCFEKRLFEKFDSNDEGYIFFDEFVRTLNVFHPRMNTNEKAKFAFDLYDVNGNGSISREELKTLVQGVMSRSVFLNLDDQAIERILDNTFEQVDIDKTSSISFDEFYRMVKENRKCIANMTIASLTTLSTEFPEFIFNDASETHD